jgi:hypothetical protein
MRKDEVEVIKTLLFEVQFKEWDQSYFAKINHLWLCEAVAEEIKYHMINNNIYDAIIADNEFLKRDETPFLNGILEVQGIPIKWVLGSFLGKNDIYRYGLYAKFKGWIK